MESPRRGNRSNACARDGVHDAPCGVHHHGMGYIMFTFPGMDSMGYIMLTFPRRVNMADLAEYLMLTLPGRAAPTCRWWAATPRA